MRLLDVESLKLEEFFGEPRNGTPSYAILSHRWGKDEVSFRDIMGDHTALAHREGFQKIVRCCAKAKSEGHNYLWVDTCCIDKSSSSELSEAINSMFQWYRKCDVCYAYLDDVRSSEDPVAPASEFRASRWFTRGWTLQELIAPYEVAFLAQDWQEIGTKPLLSSVVFDVTKIDVRTLQYCSWNHVSIARKMSWASWRSTTRVEDRAYSLMGLFDANMPLIYGEGQKAFYRLQLETIKSTEDQSIFAWVPGPSFRIVHGLLAESLEDFRRSEDIFTCEPAGGVAISYDVAKHYIQLSTSLLQLGKWIHSGSVFGNGMLELCSPLSELDCQLEAKDMVDFKEPRNHDGVVVTILRCMDTVGYIAILLKRLDSGEYVRFTTARVKFFTTRRFPKERPQKVPVRALYPVSEFNFMIDSRVLFKSLPIKDSGYYICRTFPHKTIASAGDKSTYPEAIARINQILQESADFILFFEHHLPQYPRFAIRFERQPGFNGYDFAFRVVSSSREWEQGPVRWDLEEIYELSGANAQFALTEKEAVFVKSRKAGEPWRTVGLPPLLTYLLSLDFSGNKKWKEEVRTVWRAEFKVEER